MITTGGAVAGPSFDLESAAEILGSFIAVVLTVRRELFELVRRVPLMDCCGWVWNALSVPLVVTECLDESDGNIGEILFADISTKS